MVGHRVRIYLLDKPDQVTGVLHKLNEAGAYIYREHSLPEGQGMVFIPMGRIREIVDLGRAP
jgi:hypothetical protein